MTDNVNGHLEFFFHLEIELFVIHDSGTREEKVEKMVIDSDNASDGGSPTYLLHGSWGT